MTINLWIFPAGDFAAWCELVGDAQVADYADYLALLAAIQADQERQGRTVRRVEMTVAEMRDSLAADNWPNTPDYRAAVIGLQRKD